MIIMGNAELLSNRSEMWRTIIEDLREAGRLGPGLPISCYNHPDYIKYITEPEMIPLVSPDGEVLLSDHHRLLMSYVGGCIRPCGKRLNCGHSCPWKASRCHRLYCRS